MKYYFSLFLFTWVMASQEEIMEKWNEVHKECQSNPALHVQDEIFVKLKNGEDVELPSNFGAHAFCMLKDLNLQKENGHVDKRMLRRTVHKTVKDQNQLHEIVEECNVWKDSADKTAVALFACLNKHSINIGQK